MMHFHSSLCSCSGHKGKDGKRHFLCRCRARRKAGNHIHVLIIYVCIFPDPCHSILIPLDLSGFLDHVPSVGFIGLKLLSRVPNLPSMSNVHGVQRARGTRFDLEFSVLRVTLDETACFNRNLVASSKR